MYKQLSDFMDEHVYPNEAEFNRHQASEHCWTPHPLAEEIKVKLESNLSKSPLAMCLLAWVNLSMTFDFTA